MLCQQHLLFNVECYEVRLYSVDLKGTGKEMVVTCCKVVAISPNMAVFWDEFR